jgi:small GTP-binding protein
MTLEISKKICMLGSFGVGKTSLVRRFVYNLFDDKYLTTIGVQVSQKKMPPISLGKKSQPVVFKFILWDLAHIEKFSEVIRNYFRGSHGALVVFDLSRPLSAQDPSVFLKPFRETNPTSKIVFIANKSDLVDAVSPAIDEFKQLAQVHHVPFIFTSAKTGDNVEAAFIILAEQILEAE